MQGVAPDLGKLVIPGYYNANPPGNPAFALTAGDAGLAISIGQAGGTVAVDAFGGINMQTSSTSFIGLDSLNNITLNTQNTVPNATVTVIGQSTITVSSTDGQVKLESVVNDTFMTLDLDLTLEARGALLGGGNVNIVNAGTITFDTLGPGALVNVSTINGAPPGGGAVGPTGPQGDTGPSGGPTGPQGDTGAQGDAGAQGDIGAQGDTGAQGAIGDTGAQGDTGPQGAIGDTGAQGDTGPQGAIGATGAQGSTGAQGLTGSQGATGAVSPDPSFSTITVAGTGTLTMNANPGFAGTRSAWMLFNTTGHDTLNDGILSITAAPVLDLNNVSSINALSVFAYSTLGAYQPVTASSYYVAGDNDGTKGASQISYNTATSTMSFQAPNVSVGAFSTLTGVSTINGSPYLTVDPYVLPANISVSTITAMDYVSTISVSGISSITSGNSANIDIIGGNVKISDGLTVGLTVDNATQLVTIGGTGGLSVSTITNISTFTGATDLTVSATNLSLTGGTTVYLTETGGAGLTITSTQPRITGNNGLVIDNNLSVSTITNISSINSSIFPGSVGWTSTLGSGGFTSSITGTTLTTPQLVFTPISFPQVGDYTIYQKVTLVKTTGGSGQDVHLSAVYGSGGVPNINDVYEGVAAAPYVDNTSVSTVTTMIANCRVSTIGDTKSIYLYDPSANTYTADITAANPVMQFIPYLA